MSTIDMNLLKISFLTFLLSTTSAFGRSIKTYTFSKSQVGIFANLSQKYYDEVNKELRKDYMEIELVERPLLRGLYEVDNGSLDGDAARSETVLEKGDLKNIYLLSRPIGIMSRRIVIPHNSKIKSYSEFSVESKAGYIRGDITSQSVAKKHQLFEGTNLKQLKRLLAKGRIDFIIVPELNGQVLFEDISSNFRVLGEKIKSQELKPLLNKKYKGTLFEKKLIDAIKKVTEDKLMRRLLEEAFTLALALA